MERFDVFVLGTGPAGGSIAAGLAHAGRRVGVCDAPIGGTCALRGCNPKKVLVAQADLVDRTRRLAGRGVSLEALGLSWKDLIDFARTFTDPVPDATTEGLEEAGATVVRAHARFTGPQTLSVGDTTVEAEHIVIATGAEPVPLPIEGAEHLLTSADLLARDDVPPHVLFVGAGYVATELAGVLRTAGRKVTLLEQGGRILPAFDEEHTVRLVSFLRDAGMDVRLDHTVSRIERTRDGFVAHAKHDGADVAVPCDIVVHGAGRRPRVDDLDLEAAGVAFDAKRGVHVDADLRSASNPHVFAAGDCAATELWPLTPSAEHEARQVRAAILDKPTRPESAPVLPTVAFTLPPIARVGPTTEEARAAGREIRIEEGSTDSWGSVRKVGGRGGAYKVIVDDAEDTVLGAHLLGPGVEETINLFTLAIAAKVPASAVKRMLFAFPTHASDVEHML